MREPPSASANMASASSWPKNAWFKRGCVVSGAWSGSAVIAPPLFAPRSEEGAELEEGAPLPSSASRLRRGRSSAQTLSDHRKRASQGFVFAGASVEHGAPLRLTLRDLEKRRTHLRMKRRAFALEAIFADVRPT